MKNPLPPFLEYRTPAPPRFSRPVGLIYFAALLSESLGALLTYLFVFGWGLGDSWIIYPKSLPIHYWIVPITLLTWPISFLLWRHQRTGRWLEPIDYPLLDELPRTVTNFLIIAMVVVFLTTAVVTAVVMLASVLHWTP